MIKTYQKQYKQYNERIIENFNVLNAIKKFAKGFASLFMHLIKFLNFLIIKIPKYINLIFKIVKRFLINLAKFFFGFIVSLILLTGAFALSFMYIMGYEILDVILPSVILSVIIVIYLTYQEGSGDNDILSLVQKYSLKTFLFFFINPLIKMFYNFDLKIDKKHPQKNILKIMKWLVLNLPEIIFAFGIQIILIKIMIEKIFKYILFYMNNR